MTHRRRVAALAAAGAVVLSLTAPYAGSAPGRSFPDPDTGIREDTPNDPEFDCSEPDDEDAPGVANCGPIWDAQPNLWGFAPDSTKTTAIHKTGPRNGQPMRSGVSADVAWKTTIGRPDVVVAILDTGIRWDRESLRTKIWLNPGELPARPDLDGDGTLSVLDFAGVVPVAAGAHDPKDKLDGGDIAAHYSDGTDADANGYVDDITGWDFFDDDNDPNDVSSYSSSGNHGSGRANDAAEQGNDGDGGIGVCPRCRIMPIRVNDTFVVSGDSYGLGAVYAADHDAAVIEVALGALTNSRFSQAATRYAYERGSTLAVVSSDLNTAEHNYPTNYNEPIEINGIVADTYGIGADQGNEFELPGIDLPDEVPVLTYFRNANVTQYGAHTHVGFVGDTGSFATGQAAGAFGLLASAGRDRAAQIGGPLRPAEIKQIITLTAEDVDEPDTIGVGTQDGVFETDAPKPAQPGWDEHFGYGRADLGAAMAMVAPGKIPPTVLLRTPRWWQLVDPERESVVPVMADSGSRAATHHVVVEVARGIQPSNSSFTSVLESGPFSDDRDARALGGLDIADLVALFPDGTDFGKPPASINEYAVTVRARVSDSAGNVGEDRRVLWLRHDPTLRPGWPRFVDTGGETAPRLADLDGDARLDVLMPNSSGQLSVLDGSGANAAFWNGGHPTELPVIPEAADHAGAPAFRAGVPLPRGAAHTPAVADLDGDGALEVVLGWGAGEVFAYDRTGRLRSGFPVGVDRAFSAPAVRTNEYHVKTGLFAAPSIGDIDPATPGLEIVAGALDGRVYAWHADGSTVAGFPASTNSKDTGTRRGAELITTPTLAELDGTPGLEVVVAGSEIFDPDGGTNPPETPTDLATAFRTIVNRVGSEALGGSSRAFAFDGNGTQLDGWPVLLAGILPDVLPLIGPAHAIAAADIDGDGIDELVMSSTTGEVVVIEAGGARRITMQSEVPAGSRLSDPSKILNLFEYVSVGDVDGLGRLSAFKGGLSLGAVVNLAVVGQNVPQSHALQGWDVATGQYRPAWPVPVEDYMLLTQPAITDVDGTGGPEVVQGTGLYLMHAFDRLGQEAAGFPKFTGGTNLMTPAIGDIDGDGTLDLVIATREGHLFAWSLDGKSTANEQWWTSGHDERSTFRYGTDTRPPARVQGLARAGTTVSWRATGDDWLVGTPVKQVIVVNGVARDLPADVTSVSGVPATARVEVYAVDDAGNRGLGAFLGLAIGRPPGGPSGRPTGGPSGLPATGATGWWAAVALLAVGAAVAARRSVRRPRRRA